MWQVKPLAKAPGNGFLLLKLPDSVKGPFGSVLLESKASVCADVGGDSEGVTFGQMAFCCVLSGDSGDAAGGRGSVLRAFLSITVAGCRHAPPSRLVGRAGDLTVITRGSPG